VFSAGCLSWEEWELWRIEEMRGERDRNGEGKKQDSMSSGVVWYSLCAM